LAENRKRKATEQQTNPKQIIMPNTTN